MAKYKQTSLTYLKHVHHNGTNSECILQMCHRHSQSQRHFLICNIEIGTVRKIFTTTSYLPLTPLIWMMTKLEKISTKHLVFEHVIKIEIKKSIVSTALTMEECIKIKWMFLVMILALITTSKLIIMSSFLGIWQNLISWTNTWTTVNDKTYLDT